MPDRSDSPPSAGRHGSPQHTPGEPTAPLKPSFSDLSSGGTPRYGPDSPPPDSPFAPAVDAGADAGGHRAGSRPASTAAAAPTWAVTGAAAGSAASVTGPRWRSPPGPPAAAAQQPALLPPLLHSPAGNGATLQQPQVASTTPNSAGQLCAWQGHLIVLPTGWSCCTHIGHKQYSVCIQRHAASSLFGPG